MHRSPEAQRAVDEEHLRILSICYYVSGGLSAFTGFFFLLYVLVGTVFLALPSDADGGGGLLAMGGFMTAFGVMLFVLTEAIAVVKILDGYWLSKRRNRLASLIVAGFTCIGIPWGTLLGVLTFVVLMRDSVRRDQYGEADLPAVASR